MALPYQNPEGRSMPAQSTGRTGATRSRMQSRCTGWPPAQIKRSGLAPLHRTSAVDWPLAQPNNCTGSATPAPKKKATHRPCPSLVQKYLIQRPEMRRTCPRPAAQRLYYSQNSPFTARAVAIHMQAHCVYQYFPQPHHWLEHSLSAGQRIENLYQDAYGFSTHSHLLVYGLAVKDSMPWHSTSNPDAAMTLWGNVCVMVGSMMDRLGIRLCDAMPVLDRGALGWPWTRNVA
jgi:hypothetical protein